MALSGHALAFPRCLLLREKRIAYASICASGFMVRALDLGQHVSQRDGPAASFFRPSAVAADRLVIV
jgi:hypothetical protein